MVLFIIILNIFIGFNSIKSEKCITPNSTEGNCIPLQQCEKISNVIDMQMINPDIDTLNYLIHSQCGFNATDVNVCCPVENSTLFLELNNVEEYNRTNDYEMQFTKNFADNGKCGHQKNIDAVNKGIFTTIYEHPWLALIRYKSQMKEEVNCGGVLLSSKYVLTAAHCVTGNALERLGLPISVVLGEYNLKSSNDCYTSSSTTTTTCAAPPVIVKIDEVIPHPNYLLEKENNDFDIALLRLSESVTFNDFVYPICLPNEYNILNESDNEEYAYAAGWGCTETFVMSAVKLQARVPIVKCLSTQTDTENNVDNSYICTRSNIPNSSRSDSGGPLMSFTSNKSGHLTWFVLGVANIDQERCQNKTITTYTKITPHLNWLKTTIS